MPRIVVALLAAAAIVAASPDAHAAKRMTDAQVVDRALELAALNGDEDPKTLTAVAAAHDDAVRVAMPGEEIGRDGTRVFALVLTGKFTREGKEDGASGTWPVLTLVINASTEELLDWGLGDNVPDLTPLGKPRKLASVAGASTAASVRLTREGRTVATSKVRDGMYRFTVAPGSYRLSCGRSVRVRRVQSNVDC